MSNQEKKEDKFIEQYILNDDNDNQTTKNNIQQIPDINLAKQELMQERVVNNYSAPPGLIFRFGNENQENNEIQNLLSKPEYFQFYNQMKNPRLPKPTYDPLKNKFEQYKQQTQQISQLEQLEQLEQDFKKIKIDNNEQQQPVQILERPHKYSEDTKLTIDQSKQILQNQHLTTAQKQYYPVASNQQFPVIQNQYPQIPSDQQSQQITNNQQKVMFMPTISSPNQQPLTIINSPPINMNTQMNFNQNVQPNNSIQSQPMNHIQNVHLGDNVANPILYFPQNQVQGQQPFLPQNNFPIQHNSYIMPQQFINQHMNFQNPQQNPIQGNLQYFPQQPALNVNFQFSQQGIIQGFQDQSRQPSQYPRMQKQQFGQQIFKIDINNSQNDLIQTCKDQIGSRTIQQQFQNSTDKDKEVIFEKIQFKAFELMQDVFGNYVIQKLLEFGTESQQEQLFFIMKGYIVDLSLHTYGCRVVQRALDIFKGKSQILDQIIDELNQKIIQCIEDQNGNHVIQKCFEVIEISKLKKIIDTVISNIQKLAFHSFGCRVIQKILEYCPPDKVYETREIYDRLMENLIKLCECQYGNYIIQYILEKGPQQEKEKILDVVKTYFVYLSLNKFASNVTEKSVKFSDNEFKKNVVNILLKQNTNNIEDIGIVKLTKDQFGNFVIQRLIEYVDSDSRLKIYTKLKNDPQIEQELLKDNYGKYVLQYLEKQYTQQKQ